MRIDESEDSRSQVISQLIHRPIKVPVTKPLLAQERKRFAGTGSQEKLTKQAAHCRRVAMEMQQYLESVGISRANAITYTEKLAAVSRHEPHLLSSVVLSCRLVAMGQRCWES